MSTEQLYDGYVHEELLVSILFDRHSMQKYGWQVFDLIGWKFLIMPPTHRFYYKPETVRNCKQCLSFYLATLRFKQYVKQGYDLLFEHFYCF